MITIFLSYLEPNQLISGLTGTHLNRKLKLSTILDRLQPIVEELLHLQNEERTATVHAPAGAAAPTAKCSRPPPSRIPGGAANQLPPSLSHSLSPVALCHGRDSPSPLLAAAPWPRSTPARPCRHRRFAWEEEQGRRGCEQEGSAADRPPRPPLLPILHGRRCSPSSSAPLRRRSSSI
jgi:hypothetical protein